MIESLFDTCVTLGEQAFKVFELIVNFGVVIFDKVGDILTTVGGWIGI